MAQQHQESVVTPAAFTNEDVWLHSGVPVELSQVIADQYDADDRQRLAVAAAEAAVSEIGAAYRSPIVRNAAYNAVRMALGLKTLPEQEGDN